MYLLYIVSETDWLQIVELRIVIWKYILYKHVKTIRHLKSKIKSF